LKSFRQDDQGRTVLKDGVDDLDKEIAIMKRLDHPNVIDMIEIIDDPNQEKIYMVTSYIENGAIMNWDQ